MNHRLKFLPLALSCTALTITLTGCGLGVSGNATKSTPIAAARLLTGNLHGGQQPVTGATVQLWAAGTTGATAASYGANATLVASTTSDGLGNFGFDNALGVSPCTVGQYNYITATGGNSGSGTNAQLAMIAALPTPCNSASGSQFVTINELTTVASVFALQQFMTITPGAAIPWKIGAPSTNTGGLANAFLTVGSLVSTNFGNTATSNSSNAVTSTVGGVVYTTIVNPDYTKINTLGDILSYCINSNGAACSALFADVTPSGATAPTDTIQATYYLATNPAGLTMNAHGDAAGSPNYLCSSYVTATGPFQPTIACSTPAAPATTTPVPADWAINVSFKTTSPASTTAVGTITAGNIAIDGNGNVWTASDNNSPTGGSVTALNVVGQVVVAPVTTTNISTTAGWFGPNYTGATTGQTFGGTRTNGIAIDTNNNAWASAFYTPAILVTANTAETGGTNEGLLVQVTPAGASTGYLVGVSPSALAIDGNNNIFVSDVTTLPSTSPGTRYYMSELQALGTPPAGAYSNFFTGINRSGNIFGSIAVDQSSLQMGTAINSAACVASAIQGGDKADSTNGVNGGTSTAQNVITLTAGTCIESGLAIDAKNNIWGTYPSYLEYIDTVNGTSPAPVVTQLAAGSGQTPASGGLNTPTGVAIDGLGNVWVANNGSYTVTVNGTATKVGVTGVSEFTPTTPATTGAQTTLVTKSPSAFNTAGFGSTNALSGPAGLAIDASGNVWVATATGSTLNFLVGAAAPVVTPNALAIKNTKLGLRP